MLLERSNLAFDILNMSLNSFTNQCFRSQIIVLGFIGLQRFRSLQRAVFKRSKSILPHLKLLHKLVLFFLLIVILHLNNFIDQSDIYDIFIIPLQQIELSQFINFVGLFLMVSSFEPINILLINLYFIMTLQLALNWESADCSTHSNIFQMMFIIILVCRIIAQEAAINKALSRKSYVTIMLVSSGCFLTGIGVYEAVKLAWNSNYFEYDPNTKVGNLVCYQNRIVYVAEIVACFLTVAKDIATIVMGKEEIVEEST